MTWTFRAALLNTGPPRFTCTGSASRVNICDYPGGWWNLWKKIGKEDTEREKEKGNEKRGKYRIMEKRVSGENGRERKRGEKREEGRREEKLKRTRTFRFNKILLGGPREFVRRTVITIEPRRLTGPTELPNVFIRNKTFRNFDPNPWNRTDQWFSIRIISWQPAEY